MPSRIDEAGHTKAFDYPVAEHWGESRNVQFRGWDSSTTHRSGVEGVLSINNVYLTNCTLARLAALRASQHHAGVFEQLHGPSPARAAVV